MVSEISFNADNVAIVVVLILVLVEDGLGGNLYRCRRRRPRVVLILVLVEDGLGAQ